MASESSGLTSGIAERYATALYDLADEAKALDAVAEDLRRLKGLIDGIIGLPVAGVASSPCL